MSPRSCDLRRFALGLGGGVCLLVGASCRHESADAAARKPGPVPVQVTDARKKDMPLEVTAVGAVEATDTVEITPQVTGRVLDVHFKEGDFVKRGDVLFTIDTRPYTAALQAAYAELEKNQALAAQAREDAERNYKLSREGVASEQQYEASRANAASLEAVLESDRAAIRSATLNVQFTTVKSPIDGRTGSLLLQPGNVVTANDVRPLVVIRTLAPTFVRFAVPQEYLPGIRERFERGLPTRARPRGQGAKLATGRLAFIENSVDAATGTIALKAEFANQDHALWPGEFVDTTLELELQRGVTVVPEAAIQQGQDSSFTYVVGAAGTAQLRNVKVDRVVEGEAVIASGLAPGDRVVVDGQVRLRDGARVSVKPAPAVEPSARDPELEGPPVTPGSGTGQ